jgi:ABC-type dipeptide/oligopeptide/nickel transport system permease component
VARFLIRRLLLTIPVVFGVATLVFALIHLVPGDPVQAMLGESASPADIEVLRARLGLDRPLVAQYAQFLAGIALGDLGTSLRTNAPVTSVIAERLPATVELAVAAMTLVIGIGLPLGIMAAVRARRDLDHGVTAVALIGISVPNFWLGPLLVIVFSIGLGWLPVSGRGTLAHLILPAVTLAAPLAAVLTRMTRASLLEELHQPYVLAARARGASMMRSVLNHALRNSLIPIVTVLGLQFGTVLTGAVITETIFAWPGVGRLLIQSIGFRDYPVVQGCVLLIALTYVSTNLVTDLLYGLLDPRVRHSSRSSSC